jgi:hypothetical protein
MLRLEDGSILLCVCWQISLWRSRPLCNKDVVLRPWSSNNVSLRKSDDADPRLWCEDAARLLALELVRFALSRCPSLCSEVAALLI